MKKSRRTDEVSAGLEQNRWIEAVGSDRAGRCGWRWTSWSSSWRRCRTRNAKSVSGSPTTRPCAASDRSTTRSTSSRSRSDHTHPTLRRYTAFLPGFTDVYWVSPRLITYQLVSLFSFTGFYLVLPDFIEFYWILPGLTRFYLVLPGFTGFFPGFPGFSWVLLIYIVLPDFTGFNQVLPGLTRFY